MHYGFIGGANWLWSAPPEKLGEGCKNWGGDKTFVGSHGAWKLFAPSIWLAQPTWDGEKHGAEILPNGGLRTIGPVWKGFGVRVIRSFAALFWRCGTLLQLQPGAYPKEEIER